MAFEKTLYWMTVALMAVFLGNHFAANHASHCLADRVVATIQRISANAGQLGAVAESNLAGSTNFSDPGTTMVKVQSHLATMQEALVRRQASCARSREQHTKMMALEQLQHMRVLCARQRIEIPNNSAGML